jgi:DNA-binding NtrC family response regulator
MNRATKRRVFVLSPRRADLVLYGDLLERDGCQPVHLTSVMDAAAELTAAGPGHLVLLALEGWQDSGFLDLVRIFSAQKQGIYFLGFATSTETAQSALDAGCGECLLVPVSVDTIMQAVHRQLAPSVHHGSASPV